MMLCEKKPDAIRWEEWSQHPQFWLHVRLFINLFSTIIAASLLTAKFLVPSDEL